MGNRESPSLTPEGECAWELAKIKKQVRLEMKQKLQESRLGPISFKDLVHKRNKNDLQSEASGSDTTHTGGRGGYTLQAN